MKIQMRKERTRKKSKMKSHAAAVENHHVFDVL